MDTGDAASTCWVLAFHPCVDCGTCTGRFCDYCFAADRLPAQRWDFGQPTPLCSTCDEAWDMCKYCRAECVLGSGFVDAQNPHLTYRTGTFKACKSQGATGSTVERPDTQVPGQDIRTRRLRKVRTCFGCRKQFIPTGPWKCPCRLAHYCGTACQREHWAVHKSCCTTCRSDPQPGRYFPSSLRAFQVTREGNKKPVLR